MRPDAPPVSTGASAGALRFSHAAGSRRARLRTANARDAIDRQGGLSYFTSYGEAFHHHAA
jgi:hypothetical protein